MPSYSKPKEGTVTASVWDAADAFTLKNKGQLPTAADIRAMLPEVNKATVQTQLFKWRSTVHPDKKAAPLKVVKTPDGGTAVVANK